MRLKWLNSKWLSRWVIFYLLAAFIWWAILLFKTNKSLYDLHSKITTEQSAQQAFDQEFNRQKWMIIGEAAVFVIALATGISFINRSYQKELDIVNQKRNFLLSITHELKSPLSAIKLSLETIKKRNLSEADKELLTGNAINESERLRILVEKLLLSAKLDQGFVPKLQAMDLKRFFDEELESFQIKYPEIIFMYHYQQLDDHKKEMDAFALESILSNLVENGVKYNSKKEKKIEIRVEEYKDKLHIKIGDNGKGIHDKEAGNVFKAFYRVGAEETRETRGTGLGLHIVDRLVEALKGEIDLESTLDIGSTFVLNLPLKSRK